MAKKKTVKLGAFTSSEELDAVLKGEGDYKEGEVWSKPCIITPEFAQTLLDDHNPHNRKVSKANVTELETKMRTGVYEYNGEALIIDWDFNLTNGQHTLLACVANGEPIRKQVTIGVPPESFHSLDTGRKRDLSDVFSIDEEENARLLAIAVRHVYILKNGLGINKVGKLDFSLAQSFLKANPGIRDAVSFVLDMEVPAGAIVSPGVAAALYYCMLDQVENGGWEGDRETDALKVEQFFKDFIEMDEVSKKSAAWKLNSVLCAHKAGQDDSKKLTRDGILEVIIKAWSLYMGDAVMSKPLHVNKSEKGTWLKQFAATSLDEEK